VNGEVPEGMVRALAALGPRSALAIVGAEIARVELDASRRFVAAILREDLPAGDGAPLDLAHLPSGEALALRERGLARRDASGAWARIPLALPPGAEPARIVASEGGVWIATSAGALFARDARGPFERLAPPAGSTNVSVLAIRGRELLLAGPRGALRGEVLAQLPAAREEARAKLATSASAEPSVLAVQRAALRYLALEPHHSASLRERPRRSIRSAARSRRPAVARQTRDRSGLHLGFDREFPPPPRGRQCTTPRCLLNPAARSTTPRRSTPRAKPANG
jgi:hypothetical protein